MVATEALKKDHRLIEKMLDILQKTAKKLDQGGDAPAEALKNVSVFIKTFADNYHHGKEEELLFKAMEEKGFPREGGPIGVMLIEHDEGRGYSHALAESIEDRKSTRLNSSHGYISYAVFCLKKKKKTN